MIDVDALSKRLHRLSAELGSLHQKRRVFEGQRSAVDAQLAQGDFLIARKEHEIEVIKQLQLEELREAEAKESEPGLMPDLPEEGGPDAPAPVDAAPDASTPAA